MAYTYTIIDNSIPKSPDEILLINGCFKIWKKYFEEDLSSRGETLNLNEFHRARYYAILMCDTEIAGFHLYSVFDYREDSSRSHTYMSAIHPVANSIFKENKQSMLSMEYLTVAEKFRKRNPGIHHSEAGNIAETVIRLGLRFGRELGCEVAIGVARQDRKVNKLGEKIGFTDYDTIVKYENPCSIMAMDLSSTEKSEDELAIARVENLWRSRTQRSTNFKKTA